MKSQNCIDVKHVNNLSVPYLTRFFGTVGPIKKIEKDQNSKYVTIEFMQKTSVDKAFRFEGRVLDKKPIKIKRIKQKAHLQSIIDLGRSINPIILERGNFIGSFVLQQAGDGAISFNSFLWAKIIKELQAYQFAENDKIAFAMLFWSLSSHLMMCAKHLQTYGLNHRSQYIKIQLQRQLVDWIGKKTTSSGVAVVLQGQRQSAISWVNNCALMWLTLAYPNIQECSLCKQSKVEAASLSHKCLQVVGTLFPTLAPILQDLYANSLIFNLEEAKFPELFAVSSQDWLTGKEESFLGLVQNIGAKDIFYDLMSSQQPNTCIYMQEQQKNPTIFTCTLHMKGSESMKLSELSWCNFYKAVVWKRNTGRNEGLFRIQKQQEVDTISCAEVNIVFEQSQFSCSSMCREYKKYHQIIAGKQQCRVFYIRNQGGQEFTQTNFQNLYEDDDIKVQDQRQQKVQNKQEQTFQEEVMLNLILIEIKPQAASFLNQLKLEHYLLEYIEDSIVNKGLIVASKQMAIKLAANIIEREKDSRLFEFGSSHFQKYIGEQLWRLYQRQSERKAKNIVTAYQLGRR